MGNLVSQDAQELDASFSSVWSSTFNNHPASSATWESGRPALAGGWDNTDMTKPLYKLTSPRKIVEFRIEHYKGDEYDEQGYRKPISRAVRRATSRVSVTGDFVLNSSQPGS